MTFPVLFPIYPSCSSQSFCAVWPGVSRAVTQRFRRHPEQRALYAFVHAASRCTLSGADIIDAVGAGVDVNGLRWGCAALHHAVQNDDRAAVTALLAAGADVNLRSGTGATPVWLAARGGSACVLQQLIDSGGSVNDTDSDGIPPSIAILKDDSSDDAVTRLRILLSRPELDIHATCDGQTAEYWAREADRQDLFKEVVAEVCK